MIACASARLLSQVVQLSHALRESGVSATDLYRTSRDELEGRS